METLYAYLAGAIDIEGRIFIRRSLEFRRKSGQRLAYYSPAVVLSDSDPALPDLLQATFPARRLQYEARNRKQAAWHMWEAVGESAQQPLVSLLPHLRVKQRQAELALLLVTMMQREKAGSARPLTQEQQQARHRLYEEVQLLNASRSSPSRRLPSR
jgi:hypothetical protein